jgi:hypothetical protein
MNYKKLFRIAAIFVVALGIIHTCATLFVYPIIQSFSQVDLTQVFMFVMTGFSVLFIGWLQYRIAGIFNGEGIFKNIILVTIIFMTVLGTGSVLIMYTNPFAWLSFFIALTELLLFRKSFR